MSIMILSRSLRRFVALSAAMLFLACQGTAIVYARSTGVPGSSAGAAQGSCHDPGQQTGKTANNDACQANCQSQLTSSGTSGFFAATELPAFTTHIARIFAVADSAPIVHSPLLQTGPPPLTILHCCLRN